MVFNAFNKLRKSQSLRLALLVISIIPLLASCDSKTDPVVLAPSHDQIGGTGGYNQTDAQNFSQKQSGVDPYLECGFSAQSNVAPLLNFRLTSPVLKKQGHSAQGTISSSGQQSLTVAIQFNAIGGVLDNKVQKELNQKVNTTGQVTVAPADSWEKMYVQKDPKLTQRCGVVGVSQLLNQTFPNAPFPYMIAPTLTKQRAMYEFGGAGRSFAMTIGGRAGTSRFSISPENVTLSGTAVAADYAVRVQHSYGDAQTAKSLGLAQSTIYYVKGGRFIAISEETGDGDFPIVSFF